MKLIKLFALALCASSLLLAGCKSSQSGSSATAACGMQCCTDAKATCATCPMCTAKK